MSGGISATLIAVGVDATLATTISGLVITGAEIGGGLGFVTDLAEGKGLGKSILGGFEGAALGGATAGLTAGFGPVVGGALDIGTTAGEGLVGVGLGAAGSALTGGNPIIGAVEGGIGGVAMGLTSGSSDAATDAATTGTGGSPAIAGAPGASAAPSTGSFIAPGDISSIEATQAAAALSPTSLSGSSLSTPTQLGSDAFVSPSTDTTGLAPNLSGGDTSNLGQINSAPVATATPTTPSVPDIGGSSGGTPQIPGGPSPDLNPIPPAAPVSAADQSFLNGGATSIGASNVGQGPTISNAAAVNAPNNTTAIGQLLEGNFSQAGADVGSFLSNPKNIPIELGAAFTGYEALKGPAPLSAADKSLQGQGNTLNNAANADLANAQAGMVTPAQQATINQYVQNATNQLYQQLASSGVTNPQSDSRYLQGLQQIQQQAQAMTAAYIQQTFANAMSEAGQAANDLNAAGTAATAADTAYTNALAQATAALGGAAALQTFRPAA